MPEQTVSAEPADTQTPAPDQSRTPAPASVPDPVPDPVVEIRGLVKRYGPAGRPNAVDGINLTVGRGELFGLLGPNGAGKTTTIGVATTRVQPTSGTALVGGIDVTVDPSAVKRMIGVVTQSNTLDRSCTAFENLYYHCRYFGMGAGDARARSRELLERFRLTDRADAMVMRLSGGMAQRLQLARAVAHRPAVLFLDEPTAGLDPQSRIALWDLLGELRDREDLTVVLTTHYIEEADQVCDRVAIVDHGRVLVCDDPARLKQGIGAAGVITLRLERHSELDLDALGRLDGVRRAEPCPDGVRVLTESPPGGILPARVAHAARYGLQDVHMTEPTLETVFIGLTGRELRD